jgi:hypothetical protein
MASGAFAAAVPKAGPRVRGQLADDLTGDFVVKARPVLAGASGCGFLDIADLRDGRRKLSPSSQPVTAKPVRTLAL